MKAFHVRITKELIWHKQLRYFNVLCQDYDRTLAHKAPKIFHLKTPKNKTIE